MESNSRNWLTGWGASAALFVLALAVRLPALGKFLTPDEFLWIDRSRNFLAGLLDVSYVCESPVSHTRFEQAVGLACTLRTGHPGVMTMWTGSLGILLRYIGDGMPGPLFDYVVALQTNPLDPALIAPERLPTVILMSVWVAVMYWLIRRLLGSWPVALVAGLLLALDPFHVALSRVIHHDALATAFASLSLLMALIYWTRRESRWWLVASGLVAGLAFLSKSTSLFLNLFIVVVGLWSLVNRKLRGEQLIWSDVLRTVRDGLLWFGCAVVVYFISWPAMWVIPVDTVRTVFVVGLKYAGGGHAKGNYFLGTVSTDPGPLFYPVSWLLRSSPLVWVGLAGAVFGAWRLWRDRNKRVSAEREEGGCQFSDRSVLGLPAIWLLASYALLFLVFMAMGEKKQDRYALPVYPVLNVVAAAGLVEIGGLICRALASKMRMPNARRLGQMVLVTLLLVVLLFQGVLVLANYPYYFTYYNPVFGGLQGAERMITVGWGEGLDVAADYLNQKPDSQDLQVSSWYQSTFAPFFNGKAISYSNEKGKALAGDYVVFYVNQLQRQFPDEELYKYLTARYEQETLVSLKGVDYVVVFPGPHIHHYVEDKVDENLREYQGIAALLGWDWSSAADPDLPQVEAGEALAFRLYWEYLGKLPEELFFFRLIDDEGLIVAEGTSQPLEGENGSPDTWRQGQIITEDGNLVVPPDVQPGIYQLHIGFYTQAPAVVEGELIFELPPDESKVEVLPVGDATGE